MTFRISIHLGHDCDGVRFPMDVIFILTVMILLSSVYTLTSCSEHERNYVIHPLFFYHIFFIFPVKLCYKTLTEKENRNFTTLYDICFRTVSVAISDTHTVKN